MFRKCLFIVSALSVGAAAIFAAVVLSARPAPDHPYFAAADLLPAVIAHRGGAGLGPENTLAAFSHAVELGVDTLEMDVRATSDGAIVCIHDATVDRTTDGLGEVASYTLSALQRLDGAHRWSPDQGRTYPLRGTGIRVPTLAEVFTRFRTTRMNIEIKRGASGVVPALCTLIRQFDMTTKALVASVSHDTIVAFRQACSEVATSMSAREARLFHGAHRARLDWAYSPPVPALQIPDRLGDTRIATPEFILSARGRNLKVHVWTINDEDRMRQLIASGVDGIITDRPDRLLRLLGRARDPSR
ncbi:MAG: glycerophosphodiester phosphodiesterase [Betaproteobacteria bacterium]|nr:glycerophosphodiester phosphodiesterase [Betaproteobacteria bacterium]